MNLFNSSWQTACSSYQLDVRDTLLSPRIFLDTRCQFAQSMVWLHGLAYTREFPSHSHTPTLHTLTLTHSHPTHPPTHTLHYSAHQLDVCDMFLPPQVLLDTRSQCAQSIVRVHDYMHIRVDEGSHYRWRDMWGEVRYNVKVWQCWGGGGCTRGCEYNEVLVNKVLVHM